LSQTQQAIWPTTNPIRIVVILAVIFPKTDRAQAKAASLIERMERATRASVFLVRDRSNNIHKGHQRIPN